MFAPVHLRAPRRDRALLTGSLIALAGAAWVSLFLWEGSPYGHYLHHGVDRRTRRARGVLSSPSVGS